MKALTVSELNAELFKKGFSDIYVNNIPENKWGADSVKIDEVNGISYLTLNKKVSKSLSTRVLSYSKLNAAEKHEVANFLLNL